MSLVDASYGLDDDEDVVEAQAEAEGEEKDMELPAATGPAAVGSEDALNSKALAPSVVSPSASSMTERQSGRGGGVFPQSVSSSTDSAPQIRLPDVSDLLGPSASDSQTKSDTQKKRSAANGSAHSLPRSKLPRGNLQPARVSPDTAGGLLTPPQLRGRSNVATEDLDEIFSRKQRR